MRPTMHPDDELLAAVALDESDVTAEQRRHVEECHRCTEEVEELRHTIRVASFAAQPRIETPSTAVWTAVAAQLGTGSHAKRAAPAPSSTSTVADLSRRRRRGATWLLAAACLLIGGVAGRVIAPSPTTDEAAPRPPSPAAVEVATATLDAVRGGETVGTATVSRDGLQTALTLSLPRVDPRDGYLEVWLLDRELDQMVSVGVVGDSWTPSFSIPERLLADGYVVIDVSREDFGGGPEHSGDSVLRGTLDA